MAASGSVCNCSKILVPVNFIVTKIIVVNDSVVVKDLRLKVEDKDKESSFKDKDKDEDLKIGPQGSSRTRTFLEDNNTVNTGSQMNARVF